MQEESEILELDDVVSFNERHEANITDILNTLGIAYLFKTDDLIYSLGKKLNLYDESISSLKDGIPCRVMTTRQKGWVSGKVRLGLHFIPDEVDAKNKDSQILNSSDSPLDNIRNNID